MRAYASATEAGSHGPPASAAPADLVLEATRSLLWIKTPTDAARVVAQFVTALGGSVVSAADGAALPVDISFGVGEPLVPDSPSGGAVRRSLERYLPMLVEDAQRAIELTSQVDRLAEQASIDSLTCLPNRQMVGRALGRVQPGDAVVMIDLDHFKGVNDSLGHEAGDEVLRAFGRTLGSNVRGRDTVGRYGGEEFVVVLTSGAEPDTFLKRLTGAWQHDRPQHGGSRPVTFSAGVAWARPSGDVLQAADRALYRAKEAGRDCWVFAAEA